ncbi:hypothetical protein GQ44DRAFT_823673 [Phaeosphaeriaceae sp. PMI808]|nr:hypothetical protein GQ44DRAFT_823673 [Phaeosphaeriaceae sp. PMI808]
METIQVKDAWDSKVGTIKGKKAEETLVVEGSEPATKRVNFAIPGFYGKNATVEDYTNSDSDKDYIQKPPLGSNVESSRPPIGTSGTTLIPSTEGDESTKSVRSTASTFSQATTAISSSPQERGTSPPPKRRSVIRINKSRLTQPTRQLSPLTRHQVHIGKDIPRDYKCEDPSCHNCRYSMPPPRVQRRSFAENGNKVDEWDERTPQGQRARGRQPLRQYKALDNDSDVAATSSWSHYGPHANTLPNPEKDPYFQFDHWLKSKAAAVDPKAAHCNESSPSSSLITHKGLSSESTVSPAPGPKLQPPSAPLETAENPSELVQSVDPIALVENYLEALQKRKQKELLDANRILSWIDNRSSSKHDTPQRPDIESFRVYGDESETPDIRVTAPAASCAESLALVQPNSGLEMRRELPVSPKGSQVMDTPLEEAPETVRSLYSENTDQDYNSSNDSGSIGRTKTPQHNHTVAQSDAYYTQDQTKYDAPSSAVEKDLLKEIEMLRRDFNALQQQLNYNKKNWFSSATLNQWKKALRKRPCPGTQRLEWTCDCGEAMFADFRLADEAQYQQQLAFLTSPVPATQSTVYGHPPPSDLESGMTNSTNDSQPPNPSGSYKGKAPTSTSGSSTIYVGSSESQSFVMQPNTLFPMNKYLELCVNVGKYETKLAEIQVTSSSVTTSTIFTDAHLFSKIYNQYFTFRKPAWRRFLYRPSGIKALRIQPPAARAPTNGLAHIPALLLETQFSFSKQQRAVHWPSAKEAWR